MFDNVQQYRDQFKPKGQGVAAESHIQPVVIGGVASTMAISKKLFEQNIIATAIRPPTVPKGTSRLRLSFTAAHKPEQINMLTGALNKAVNAL